MARSGAALVAAYLLAFAAGPVAGNDAARLREDLRRCWGNESLQAVVRVEQWAGVKKGGLPATATAPEAIASFEIGAAGNAVTVRLPEKEVRQEDRAPRDAKTPSAPADGLANISLSRAASLVNYGPALARALDGFRIEGRKPDVCQGAPCTKWSLGRTNKESAMGMSMTEDSAWDIWTDAEGYPVAAQHTEQTKTKALLIGTTSRSQTSYRFRRHGRRLVLVFEQSTGDHEVAGSRVSVTTTTTIDLSQAPPAP
jgi:hypothetical protein